jgi:hypothetical protein
VSLAGLLSRVPPVTADVGGLPQHRGTHVKHLFLTALLSATLLAQAQPTSGTPSPSSATADTASDVDPALQLPELNPAEWFDGKGGGTFGEKSVNFLPRSKRVALVGFRVIFVNETFARARVRASYLPGRDTTGASAGMQVNLKGVDDATLQALTDKAYARFVAQLRASGREVITPADGKWDNAVFQGAPGPVEVAEGNTKGRAFAPKGMSVWSLMIFPWAASRFDQTAYRAMSDVSQSLGAPLTLATTLVVDFAQMTSTGNRSGLVARTAEVGTTLAISVSRMDNRIVRAEESRSGIVMKGDDGPLSLTRAIESDIEFAVLSKTEKDHGSGFGGFLSKAFVGTGKTAFRLAETSNEEYGKAATAVLERTTGTFAKLLAAHPAP